MTNIETLKKSFELQFYDSVPVDMTREQLFQLHEEILNLNDKQTADWVVEDYKTHDGQRKLLFFGYDNSSVSIRGVWESEVDKLLKEWEIMNPIFGVTGSKLPRLKKKV